MSNIGNYDFPSPLELKKGKHPSTVRRVGQQKAFVAFLKKITQTLLRIGMIQSLLYRINWPAILDLESVGTGPSSHLILLPFRENFFACI